jgi:iron complex outermembrane receptor protein
MLRPLAALVLLAAPLHAQTLTGRVTDGFAALPGATVVLQQGALRVDDDATDADGAYRLDAPAAGRYTLRVSYVGFAAFEQPVDLPLGTRTLDVVLDARLLPADEVVVAAGRPAERAPVTTSSLTAAELEALPDAADLPILLASQPGVTFSSDGGSGLGYTSLRLRGWDQRRVAISVNGVPQNDPEDLGVFWLNFFDLRGSVTDVQVQRGAASAAYGQSAVAGAVNVVADPFRPDAYASAEVGYGAFDTQRLTLEAGTGLVGRDRWGGRYSGYLRLSRVQTDGYRTGAWVEVDRFFAGVTRYGERSRLTLLAFGGPQRDGLAYAGVAKNANADADARRYNYSADPLAVFRGEEEYFQQPQVHLYHELGLADGLDLEQTLFWIRGDGYFDFDATFRSADYLRLPAGFVPDELRGADLFTSAPGAAAFLRAAIDQHQIGWMPSVRTATRWGSVAVGGEARLHRSLKWGRIQDGVGLPADLIGSANDVRVYSFRGEKAVASGFASVLGRPTPDLALQYETRLTWRQYRIYDEAFYGTDLRAPFTFWDHRAGATLFPDRDVRLYANAALASREPRLKTIYDGEEPFVLPRVAGETGRDLGRVDPLVQPERGVTAEVGAEWEGPRHRLHAGGYGYWVRDEIVPSGGVDQFGQPRTGNAERTRHLGLEAEASVRLLPGLDATGNVTLSSDRFTRFSEFVFADDGSVVAVERDGNRIAGFPTGSAYGALSYARGPFSVRLDAIHRGPAQVDNSGRGGEWRVDAYTLVGAGAAWRPGGGLRGLELSVEVQNLLNDRILLSGVDTGFGPSFFPAATRHAFVLARYTVGRR